MSRPPATPKKRSESEFQKTLIDLLKIMRLWHYHVHDSRTAQAGWPDLVIVGPNGMLLRELKTQTGRLSATQKHVITILRTAGQDVDVWRPADLQSGRILQELNTIR